MNIFGKIRNQFGKPSTLWRERDMTSTLEYLEVIDIEIAEHCNLNCNGCTHFSPVSQPRFYEIKKFEQDLLQLHNVFKDKIHALQLLGGEPLLNKDVAQYMIISRKIFPYIKIKLLTNGLLLPKMNAEFWKVCRENNIELEATKYPIKFDYKEVVKVTQRENVKFDFYGRSKYVQKTQYSLPLDFEGLQDKEKSFNNCHMARACFTLNNGKLFTCPYASSINRFNEYFKQNMEVCEDDYVDIYKETDVNLALEKLSRPIPFCRYCNVEKRTYGNKWKISKKSIDEWT